MNNAHLQHPLRIHFRCSVNKPVVGTRLHWYFVITCITLLERWERCRTKCTIVIIIRTTGHVAMHSTNMFNALSLLSLPPPRPPPLFSMVPRLLAPVPESTYPVPRLPLFSLVSLTCWFLRPSLLIILCASSASHLPGQFHLPSPAPRPTALCASLLPGQSCLLLPILYRRPQPLVLIMVTSIIPYMFCKIVRHPFPVRAKYCKVHWIYAAIIGLKMLPPCYTRALGSFWS